MKRFPDAATIAKMDLSLRLQISHITMKTKFFYLFLFIPFLSFGQKAEPAATVSAMKAVTKGDTLITKDPSRPGREHWIIMDTKGNIKGQCARDPGEGKPKCLPQSKAHSLGKEGRAAAARRKRREDPNPERRGKPINVRTK
mgnify:CR=1 FL=1